MSRRKDRERVEAQRQINPDYHGFRGYEHEPGVRSSVPLTTAVCSKCGRRRNVPVGIAEEQREAFVCLSCRGNDSEIEKPTDLEAQEVPEEPPDQEKADAPIES